MQADNMFWIASMTKSITGTALMMLVQEGKVKLDDPVEKFLPEFKGQKVLEDSDPANSKAADYPITVREVMDHTSGVVQGSQRGIKPTNNLEQDVKNYASVPLKRQPGTKYEYNNSGINTGGRIIEVVSGMPYAQFIQTRLLDSLEMKDTTFWPNPEQGARLASTARRNAETKVFEDLAFDKNITPAFIQRFGEGAVVPQPMLANFGGGPLQDYAKHYAMPAGGLFSTAADLGKFCQMLLCGGTYHGKTYLNPETLKEMTQIQTGDVMVSPTEGYGVGWSVKRKTDEGVAPGSFGHRGARKTMMWIDPERSAGVLCGRAMGGGAHP